MSLWSWLRERFDSSTDYPILLRVRNAGGGVVPKVELVASSFPQNTLLRKTLLTASGVCILHWPPLAKRLQVEIRADEGSACVEVERSRPHPQMVIEVQLA